MEARVKNFKEELGEIRIKEKQNIKRCDFSIKKRMEDIKDLQRRLIWLLNSQTKVIYKLFKEKQQLEKTLYSQFELKITYLIKQLSNTRQSRTEYVNNFENSLSTMLPSLNYDIN